MTINILSEDLINKIAAGEVVERPASVVKELVENSLDAGATNIEINIKNSGKDLIQIKDNGSGMSKEDAEKSIIRHATSKISSVDDLFAISTLGFRGEALASIAAVSQVSLITKQEGTDGIHLTVESGNIINSDITPADTGTTIEVHNLFFNTPARKKFLKTDAVELRHIIDVVTHYALLHNNVSFKLTHENHTLLFSPSSEDQRNNIASIYGASVAKDLLEVNHKDDTTTINGFISKPYQARNDRNQQVFFVNDRWIKSSDLRNAVYEGFHSMLFVNKHPVFVLSIKLNNKEIDVNVHPQKFEIKIENQREVSNAITKAVKSALEDANLIPVVSIPTSSTPPPQKKPVKYNFDQSSQTQLEVKESPIILTEKKLASVVQEAMAEPVIQKLPQLKLFGQIHKTFFVAETEGGVYFIDQHAAHERVVYEKFMKQYMDENISTQTLLKPELIELTVTEAIFVTENIGLFLKFGFSLIPFGGNSFQLQTVPVIFNRLQPKNMFHQLLSTLSQGGNSVMGTKETIITRMACRAAVMAGDELNTTQIQQILSDLEQCEHPFTCPHGRPTMIKTEAHDLEKKFRRC